MSARTGTASLPLHGGHAPRWLFEKMTTLGRQILLVMAEEFGSREILRRLADPFWFQALGCLLGFDWHSSGVTTTVLGALKEGTKGIERETGLVIAGGKGRASCRTPQEILAACDRHGIAGGDRLVALSRLTAKVDSNALQDGYQLYHHVFLFTSDGRWGVVQQGMNEKTRYARRYHWLSETVTDPVNEPHAAICAEKMVGGAVLNFVAAESAPSREAVAELSRESPERLLVELRKLADRTDQQHLALPSHHQVLLNDLYPDSLRKTLLITYERQPNDFRTLLGLPGVGGKTLRALGLLAELLYGHPVSSRDPVKFSFAHGGKDGHPYPVDRETYDTTIDYLTSALARARIGRSDRLAALKRLARL